MKKSAKEQLLHSTPQRLASAFLKDIVDPAPSSAPPPDPSPNPVITGAQSLYSVPMLRIQYPRQIEPL